MHNRKGDDSGIKDINDMKNKFPMAKESTVSHIIEEGEISAFLSYMTDEGKLQAEFLDNNLKRVRS